MAAMDPVGNEKLGRTSSVFSTLLDDFETTPGITFYRINELKLHHQQNKQVKNSVHFVRT